MGVLSSSGLTPAASLSNMGRQEQPISEEVHGNREKSMDRSWGQAVF